MKLSDQFFAGQLNIGYLNWIAADTTRYGYYINSAGGSVWGHHSFLLKRDLEPASNDNLPLGLSAAA